MRIRNNICIFCRGVKTLVVATSYLVKYTVFKKELTPQLFEAHMNTLGPVAQKILQIIGPKAAADMLVCITKDKSPQMKAEYETKVRNLLNNNSPLPMDKAQKILSKSYGSQYMIKAHLGTGTIASCYRVEDTSTGKTFIAKVIPENKQMMVDSGVFSFKLLTLLLPSWISQPVNEALKSFSKECRVFEECDNLKEFKQKMAETTTQSEQITYGNESMTIACGCPDIVNEPVRDDSFIMEDTQGVTLCDLIGSAPQVVDNRTEQFRTCFGRAPVNEDECKRWVKHLHFFAKLQWHELRTQHGLVHCDLHPGNIMITFSRGQAKIWFIDMGNCARLSSDEQKIMDDFTQILDGALIGSLDESNDYQNDPHIRNLMNLFKAHMTPKDLKKFTPKKEAKCIKEIGEFLHKEGRIYRLLMSFDRLNQDTAKDGGILIARAAELLMMFPMLLRRHHIYAPPCIGRTGFAVIRGEPLPLFDRDIRLPAARQRMAVTT